MEDAGKNVTWDGKYEPMLRLIIFLGMLGWISMSIQAQIPAKGSRLSSMSASSISDASDLGESVQESSDMSQLFLPILLAVIGFIGKSIWDIFTQRRTRQISLLQQKLSTFYWPVAVRAPTD